MLIRCPRVPLGPCGPRSTRGYIPAPLRGEHGAAHYAPLGRVLDFFAEPGWLAPLFAACVDRFRRSDAAAVYCRAVADGLRGLRRVGFVRRPSTIRLMAYTAGASDEVREALAGRGAWFVTGADSDRDHGNDEEKAGAHSDSLDKP